MKMENNPALYIGKVEAVRGRSVEINVHKSKNSPHLIFNGKIIKGVSVGSHVKICKGFQELIGKVYEEYIDENKLISQKDYKQEKERIKRFSQGTRRTTWTKKWRIIERRISKKTGGIK